MTTKHRMPVIVAHIAVVTYSGGCITDDGSPPSTEHEGLQGAEQTVEGKVLAIAAQHPEVSAFIAENPGYHYEITALSPANLTELAQTYPVIYGNLPSTTLYQIEYNTDGRGLLVIVDLENETVVRYFRTAGVSLE